MKNFIKLLMISVFLVNCQKSNKMDVSKNSQIQEKSSSSDAYDTYKEDFSVSEIKNGYSNSESNELHNEWSLNKFLDITKSGAYSYINLPEFMPHAIIKREGPVVKLEKDTNSEIGKISLENESGQSITFEDMITAKDSPIQGVMILHKGKVVYEKYPGMREFDNHVWMSNSKILAGLLIAQFEEKGLLDVQKTVSDYLEEAKGTAWENIKIIDILNMQSGLDLEENPVSRKGGTPYSIFAASEVGEAKDASGKVLTHNEALFRIPKLHEPGIAFEYSSANTQMLGLILEEVGKKRLNELITERIWKDAGMEGDATLGLSPQGNGVIHGLISSRLEDMAKIGLLYTPSWNVISPKQIVSNQVLKKIQTSGKKENYLKGTLGPRMAKEFRDTPEFNSYQWDAVFSDGDIYKSGMNGQGIYVSPFKDLVIVWFATGFGEIEMEAFARKIARTYK